MTWPVLAATHFGPLGPLGVNQSRLHKVNGVISSIVIDFVSNLGFVTISLSTSIIF
jgi:hypothetical protein